tara:strand:- start:14 stop:310 length:297 start_codon:yes stop_codon:yes gene_type:complete
MKKLDDYLEKAIENIHEDREITRELLDDVVNFLSKNEENHKVVGLTAAKYVETLQRSNEQLVKVAAIIQKNQSSSAGLSDLDKSELFDMIGGAKDGGS